jgi:hypothetical protein
VVGTEGWSIRSNRGWAKRRASISLLVPRTFARNSRALRSCSSMLPTDTCNAVASYHVGLRYDATSHRLSCLERRGLPANYRVQNHRHDLILNCRHELLRLGEHRSRESERRADSLGRLVTKPDGTVGSGHKIGSGDHRNRCGTWSGGEGSGAVLARRRPHDALEYARKVSLVGKASGGSNIGKRCLPPDHGMGHAHARLCLIGVWR